MPVFAYAADGPREALVPWIYQTGPLGDGEIDLAVTDREFATRTYISSMMISGYPTTHSCPDTRSSVRSQPWVVPYRTWWVGQRVGVGWQRGACEQCEWCQQGLQNLCAGSCRTPLAGHGRFASSLRVDSRFAIPIPDALDSAMAAPLLCAGITVYSPLSRLVRPACRVGVIGIGGLGHLALQFARAMGAEVFAFSTSTDKEHEAQSPAHTTLSSALTRRR